jgi:hypothetical protein
VAVLPAKFYGVIADRFNTLQFSVWNGDESSLGAMPLAQCARTKTAQIVFRVFAGVTVIPGNAHQLASCHMINLGRVV